jgi:hypothetical protein
VLLELMIVLLVFDSEGHKGAYVDKVWVGVLNYIVVGIGVISLSWRGFSGIPWNGNFGSMSDCHGYHGVCGCECSICLGTGWYSHCVHQWLAQLYYSLVECVVFSFVLAGQ